ncbi:MAG: cobalt transporter CbiM [Clostridiales bacterium]|nr:cobalt transporter CbiM [Clostridiales bacterium]MCF8022915.1 cobalt transporter CbiM [Clostridiales bacterium]
MHIPDGVLPTSVCAAGYAVTGIAVWYSLRKLNKQEDPRKDIPKASLVTAAFFVTSWIHIPIPPTSVHLMLTGLLGALLGYYAYPAAVIALFFQAVMFQHGGLTTIGVNAVILGIPAMLCHYIYSYGKGIINDSKVKNSILGLIIGVTGTGLSVFIWFLILINFISANLNASAERAAIITGTLAHVPLMALEGVFTAFILVYLKRVKPELLGEQSNENSAG